MPPVKRKKKPENVDNDKAFDLGQQIAELRGIVITGFKGVHARQDITNGRIAKVEDRVDTLEIASATSAGRRKGAWAFWTVLSTIIGLIIGLLTIIALTGCWSLFCK